MSERAILVLALAVAGLLAPGAASDAFARPPAPIGLEVDGGEESWHDSNRFRMGWQLPETGFSLPIVGTDYVVLGPSGNVVAERRWDEAVERTEFLLHGGPGRYTVEVWLEDMVGAGPHAEASLRYDDSRPGFATAEAADGWIGRADFPHTVRIEHPQGPAPPSGIRGYAVSIDGSPEGGPCEDPSRCTETETDLRGGVGDDSLTVPELPEGESHVHVVAVSGSGMSSAEAGDTVLRVDRTDPVTQLGGAPGGWANRAVAVTVTAADSGSGMAGDGAFTAVQIDGARPTLAAGDSVSATVIGDGIHHLAHYAQDVAGNVNDGATRNGVRDRPPALATIGIDRDPPEVAFLDSQDPADPELIRAVVADPLAGPSATRGLIGVRAAGSGDRFQPLATQVVPSGLRARWDSEAFPPGRYEFRATGYDVAGNATIAEKRVDGAPMLLANPLKTSTSLNIGFGGETLVWQHCTRKQGGRRCRREEVSDFGSRPRSRVVPYGRGTLVSGRLATEAGAPLAGPPVKILEHLGRGSGSSTRLATVATDPDGRFSLRLPAGPSREISASFDGTRTLTHSATTSLRLGVRTRVRLRVSSHTARVGGAPVIFSGRVMAGDGEIPAQGKALALQFRLRGVPWTEFRTVRTDRNGRFRYAYAFSDDDSRGARFQFRAHAAAQSDWPYEPGSSGPVAVLGI